MPRERVYHAVVQRTQPRITDSSIAQRLRSTVEARAAQAATVEVPTEEEKNEEIEEQVEEEVPSSSKAKKRKMKRKEKKKKEKEIHRLQNSKKKRKRKEDSEEEEGGSKKSKQQYSVNCTKCGVECIRNEGDKELNMCLSCAFPSQSQSSQESV